MVDMALMLSYLEIVEFRKNVKKFISGFITRKVVICGFEA